MPQSLLLPNSLLNPHTAALRLKTAVTSTILHYVANSDIITELLKLKKKEFLNYISMFF